MMFAFSQYPSMHPIWSHELMHARLIEELLKCTSLYIPTDAVRRQWEPGSQRVDLTSEKNFSYLRLFHILYY